MGEKDARGFRIDTSLQMRMFPQVEMPSAKATPSAPVQTRFERGDPRKIFIGPMRLDEHLKRSKLRTPLIIRAVLEKQDWSKLEAKYKPGGRPPYEPMGMLGLILSGTMSGVDSLRDFEEVTRRDLGCMWVCGGITPDHSSIGRFIVDHAEFLEGPFFEQITRTVLKHTRSAGKRLAIDGTTIQAAAGRYKTLKAEALREYAKKARSRASDDGSKAAAERAKQAERAVEVVDERNEARGEKGRDAQGARVSPIEPDAVLQKMKDQSFAPSYKPSVVANEQRIILGQTVHSSSEIAAVEAMLDQAERISEEKVETLLADAGYHADEVITHALARGIDLLCPSGSLDKPDGEQHRKSNKLFALSLFSYDENHDTYRCPAGATLTCRTRKTDAKERLYRTDACAGCPLRAQCSSNPDGREIKRHPGDDAKDALAQTMSHPQARLAYSQRKAMVEPVFADLKECQKFRRFRRRGLAKVRVEFSLRAIAHNLRRLVAVLSAVLSYLTHFERFAPLNRRAFSPRMLWRDPPRFNPQLRFA